MTEYVWTEARDELCSRWADTPNATLEQRILIVFAGHPQLVLEAADQITERYERGVVRSPWAVLAKHVEEAASIAERSLVPTTGKGDRARARARAAQWIKSCGIHFDREEEVEAELFERQLRDHAGDDELRDELLALWAAERPRGERTESEAGERMRIQGVNYHRQRQVIAASHKLPLDQLAALMSDAEDAPAEPEAVPAGASNPFISEGV